MTRSRETAQRPLTSTGRILRITAALAAGVLISMAGAGRVAADETIKAIHFAHGSKQAAVGGSVVRGGRDTYSLTARKGQILSVRVTSLEHNAVFQVYGPRAEGAGDGSHEQLGAALPGAGDGDDATKIAARLKLDGRYFIVVGPSRGNTTYRLAIALR